MPNKMLSLKVSLEPVLDRHRQRRLRLVMELLEQEASRHSQPPIETESQSLLADAATQSPSNNPLANAGGQR
jgi:hypothetical protein